MTAQHGITEATYQRFLIDAGEIRVNYVDVDNPGIRLGATRGGNVFEVVPEYHHAAVDGAKGPVVGEERIERVTVRMRVNVVEIVPWVLSMGLPGSTVAVESE